MTTTSPEEEPSPSKWSLGGKARDAALTREQKSEIASKAAKARWAFPKATHEDRPIVIGGHEIPCAVLEGEVRVLSERAVTKVLGGKRGGAHWLRMKDQPEGGAMLPVYLSAPNLTKFIDKDLMAALKPVVYITKSGGKAYGLRAELLPKICNVFLKARDVEGGLHWKQRHLAKQAEILVRGLAEVAIVALVDEATGFQKDRAQDALAEILEKFIAKELRAWTQTFPLEFYEQIFRLKGWAFDAKNVRRPGVIGHYTNDVIYRRLAPGVLPELVKKNPAIDGRRKHKHFQWLTGDIGEPKLKSHFDGVLALMRASEDWDGFRKMLVRAFPIVETTDLGFDIEIKEG